MVQINRTFTGNLEDLDRTGEYKIAAPGRYPVVITGESVLPTVKGTGVVLTFNIQIVEGEFKGVKIWKSFNIENPNPLVVKIADDELTRISIILLGRLNYGDTKNFHNKILLADIDTEPYTDKNQNKKIKNIIKRFYHPNVEFKELAKNLTEGRSSGNLNEQQRYTNTFNVPHTAKPIDDEIPF